MPGLDPGIHANTVLNEKTWMAGSSPAMTEEGGGRSASNLEAELPPLPNCLWHFDPRSSRGQALKGRGAITRAPAIPGYSAATRLSSPAFSISRRSHSGAMS